MSIVAYVAVVGPGESASRDAIADATEIGTLIAQRGWITLTGGRRAGVMAAAAAGARTAGGIAIGLLPGDDRRDAAPELSAALPTGLGCVGGCRATLNLSPRQLREQVRRCGFGLPRAKLWR